MQEIVKYENLISEFPKLQKVLADAIQSDFLEIRKVDKSCLKYQNACDHFEGMCSAEYVVFSKYIKKSEHKHEMFVFIDDKGEVVVHVNGLDMELYGLLQPCTNLQLSEDYKAQVKTD